MDCKAFAFVMLCVCAFHGQCREAVQNFPPALTNNQAVVTAQAAEFLKPASTLRAGVAIAKTPPRVDLMYFPGQDYPGKPWSAWGDSTVANGKYYASIGDHLAIGAKGDAAHTGNAFVFEYDPATQVLRRIVDVQKTL